MLPAPLVRFFALPLAVLVLPDSQTIPLSELVNRSYLDLAQAAPSIAFDAKEAAALRTSLAQERKTEQDRMKKEEAALDLRIKELRRQLTGLNKEASQDSPRTAEVRNKVHCDILRLEKDFREMRLAREHGLPVAFDNKLAKLDMLARWPSEKAAITRLVAEGKARQRRYGDVEDIGIRQVSADQEKDIKLGQEAQRDLKMYSLMPPEMEDKEVRAYVQGIADRIAANSDVRVPVKLAVLYSPEINAFALPGGFLFVNTGLIDKAENESELAGVMAHELAHVSARHGAKLMRRANIAGIMYQMAQIAVMISTGGIATIGAYYLFQAGFMGLGLVLDLTLLGVSREFEAEADQLGAQYAWKAGYDPRGFITFFDKMASEKGYAKSASFFRTHPPFLERILSTLSEIEYLPKTTEAAMDSSAFRDFKTKLTKALSTEKKRQPNAPTLQKGPTCPDDNETPTPKPRPVSSG